MGGSAGTLGSQLSEKAHKVLSRDGLGSFLPCFDALYHDKSKLHPNFPPTPFSLACPPLHHQEPMAVALNDTTQSPSQWAAELSGAIVVSSQLFPSLFGGAHSEDWILHSPSAPDTPGWTGRQEHTYLLHVLHSDAFSFTLSTLFL